MAAKKFVPILVGQLTISNFTLFKKKKKKRKRDKNSLKEIKEKRLIINWEKKMFKKFFDLSIQIQGSRKRKRTRNNATGRRARISNRPRIRLEAPSPSHASRNDAPDAPAAPRTRSETRLRPSLTPIT